MARREGAVGTRRTPSRHPMSIEHIPYSVSGQAIRRFFDEIATTYDWINVLMTAGLDSYWRKRAARLAARQGGNTWLDICAGTGQMTLNLARRVRSETTIVALDFCMPMLRALPSPSGTAIIRRCLGDVCRMPFPDACFDLVTVSFATRNLHTSREHLLACFREIRRVLKPGGRFMNLETSQPSSPLVRSLFHAAIGASVRAIGPLVSGSSLPYHYLASSMQTFYSPEQLGELLTEAGFQRITWMPMTFGAVAAHLAWKMPSQA